MKKQITLFSTILIAASMSFGQATKRTCASHTLHSQKMNSNQGYAARTASLNTIKPINNLRTTAEAVYSLPVVVHVIHNGEALGSGQNISDAQINSAITALNKDFRKLNSDTLAPSHAFYSLQSDVGIEFCLASKDPQGNSTTGINRYNKGQAAWTVSDFDTQIKPTTAWDRTKYINIWITNFASPDDQTLGYATFPGTNDATDGVVIGYSYFGTTGNVAVGFDLNRTATHEVGHYFNLYHIWGDATCGDDLVADTPTQENANDGFAGSCPTFPHNTGSSCNPGINGEMFMNYMDYVDDACMSLFTSGQKDRMRAALTGARASLLTSDGCSIVTNTASIGNNSIAVFPNPASSQITITSNEIINSVIVYSIGGTIIASFQGDNSTNLDINTSSFANGNYFVKVTSENGVFVKEVVIIQ